MECLIQLQHGGAGEAPASGMAGACVAGASKVGNHMWMVSLRRDMAFLLCTGAFRKLRCTASGALAMKRKQQAAQLGLSLRRSTSGKPMYVRRHIGYASKIVFPKLRNLAAIWESFGMNAVV